MAYTSRQEDPEKKYEVQPYQSQWQSQLDDTMGKILNREKFNYDLNGDALYQQYKDRYVNQGRMAMMDTMGQAQAMTGGYGNSYAQSVGQQTYQNYLQGLNDKIPELYNLALSKYQMEGDQLKDQYSILGNQEAQDYSRWAADRDFGYGQFVDDRNYQYQMDEQNYGRWQDQQALALQQAQAMIAQGVRPSDEMLEQAGLSKEYLDAMLPENAAAGGSEVSGGYWLNPDGSVNLNLVSQSSKWFQDYAAKNGIDPKTGKKITTGSGGETLIGDVWADLYESKDAGATQAELLKTVDLAESSGYITSQDKADIQAYIRNNGWGAKG